MKKAVLALVVVVVLGIAAYAAMHKNSEGETSSSAPTQQPTLSPVSANTSAPTAEVPAANPAPAPAPAQAPTTAPAAKPAQAPSSQPGTYTMAVVAQHATAASCWSAINGGVYDLTAWIGQHPGGKQAILSICGKDGSSAFNDQHGGQRRPANELAGLKIGTLAQ